MQANKQGFKAFDPQAAAELAKVSGSVPGSRILVFLHDDRERGLALDAFRAAGLQAHGVKTVAAARKLLGEDFDAFVIDADHPEEDGGVHGQADGKKQPKANRAGHRQPLAESKRLPHKPRIRDTRKATRHGRAGGSSERSVEAEKLSFF
jgi:hypothetical protein